MEIKSLIITLVAMALTCYALRAVPLVLFKKKIENRFLKSILAYVPYAVIASITFPNVIYCTGNPRSAIIGFAVAIILAFLNKSLITVCASSIVVVFAVEKIMEYMVL